MLLPQFRKQFNDKEKQMWTNTLERLFIHTGPDELGMEFYSLVSGIKERTFAANIDRTKIYDDVIVCSTIPKLRAAREYSECMKQQAKYIQSIITEYHFTPYLLWSGGLDSTGVFYALLDENIKFNVIFNQSSFNEYPKLAQALIDNEIENATPLFVTNGEIIFPEHPKQNKDALYITGDGVAGIGDLYKWDYNTRQLPIEDCIGKLISKHLYEKTSPSINTIIKNPTWAEYIWALDFIYKYQGIILKIGAMGLSSYGPKQNTIHFYNNDNFQLYGMNYFKDECDFVREADYKKALRKYIFEQNHDEIYFKNKIVLGSFLVGAYSSI